MKDYELLKGEIVGKTYTDKFVVGDVTIFSVKSLEGEIKKWRISNQHESLIPGRKIILKYNPNSTYPWAEGYTLFDEQGDPFYSFRMDFDSKFSSEI